MHALGIGTDIVSIERFRTLPHRERAARFFLREEELANAYSSRDVAQFLASRFAAKEAVIKALPVAMRAIDFYISTVNGKPAVVWHIPSPYTMLLSLSHEKEYACATA